MRYAEYKEIELLKRRLNYLTELKSLLDSCPEYFDHALNEHMKYLRYDEYADVSDPKRFEAEFVKAMRAAYPDSD